MDARLLAAAGAGDVEAVRGLLCRGADPNVVVNGDTPAAAAARAGHRDCYFAICASPRTRPAALLPELVDPRVAPVVLLNTVERDRCVMAAKMYHELAFLVTELHVHQSAPENMAVVPSTDAHQLALLFFAPQGTFCCPKRARPLSVAVKITATAMRACVGATLEETMWATDLAKSTLAATESYDVLVRAAALDVLRNMVQNYRCALFLAAVPLEPLTAFLAIPDDSSVARMLVHAWGLFVPLRLCAPDAHHATLPGHTMYPVRVHRGVLGVHVGRYAVERAAKYGDARAERDTLAICPCATWIMHDDHVEVTR